MARAYRKKPVVVEAVQWTGENRAEMCEFIDPEVFEIIPRVGLVIHTLEGDHHASPGDYIIKGVNGELYPCKPDIFAKTYESAALTPPNEPLTLDELLEMGGEPVWVESIQEQQTQPEGWCVIGIFGRGRFFCALIPGDEDTPWESDTYGKCWLAYRRPPEGGDGPASE